MKLYNDIIEKVLSLLPNEKTSYQPCKSKVVRCLSYSFLFDSDTAFEMGKLPNIGAYVLCPTSSEELVPQDEIVVIGKDIKDLKDGPYARIVLARVKDDASKTENDIYKLIKKIDYTRFRFYYEDVMVRVAPSDNIESIKIGKKSVKQKITLQDIGSAMIEDYHKISEVEAVKIIFVTLEDGVNYKELKRYSDLTEKIVETFDHALKHIQMDCATCSLKAICEQVDGLKEMHFKKTE